MKEAASSQPKPAKEELVEESDSSAPHDKEAKCPPKTRERSPSTGDSSGSDGKEQAPAQGASEPGADQEMKDEDDATPTKENVVSNSPRQAPANEATLEEEGHPGDTSPDGPVETPRHDETSSCYQPVRLKQGPAAEEGELRPRPDYAETMEFVVKLHKDVRPCHSRYHPELRVILKNHEASLPQEVKDKLHESEPKETPEQAALSASREYKTCTVKLRDLGHKKVQLQARVDDTKARLREQLESMKELMTQIDTAQAEVNKVAEQFKRTVLVNDAADEPPSGDTTLTQLLTELGISLTPEQQDKLKAVEEGHAIKKRKHDPSQAANPPEQTSSGRRQCTNAGLGLRMWG